MAKGHTSCAMVAIRNFYGGIYDGQKQKQCCIAVGNQKGELAKRPNTIQLAAALAELGQLSLIIGFGDLTSGAQGATAPFRRWNSSFELLTRRSQREKRSSPTRNQVPLPTNVHLVPSSRKLAELNTFWPRIPGIHQDLLVDPIAQLRGRYDYIFLDTPPQKTRQLSRPKSGGLHNFGVPCRTIWPSRRWGSSFGHQSGSGSRQLASDASWRHCLRNSALKDRLARALVVMSVRPV